MFKKRTKDIMSMVLPRVEEAEFQSNNPSPDLSLAQLLAKEHENNTIEVGDHYSDKDQFVLLDLSNVQPCGDLMWNSNENWDNGSEVRCFLSPALENEVSPMELEVNEFSNQENLAVPEDFELDGCRREVNLVSKIKKNKRLVAKVNRNKGKTYVSPSTNKVVSAKTLKPRCNGDSCRRMGRKCADITHEERDIIFSAFYKMGKLHNQREYINRYARISTPKQKTTKREESRRLKTVSYFLPKGTSELQVCKTFFLNTLSVSEKVVRTALEKKQASGVVEPEKRGGRTQDQSKRDSLIKLLMTNHVNRFPRVESHYCRSNSKKEYLHPDLTKKKMYRMFVEEHKDILKPLPHYNSYVKVFKSLNLSFHHPKKDMCGLCSNYQEGDKDKKAQLEEKFRRHTNEKLAVRQKKKEAKEYADEKTAVAVFDLQQVIYLPKSNDSKIFYKRRLSTFNFTVYNLKTKECHCFTWHEGVSRRGASEIATCLFKYLIKLDEDGFEEVHFFSDGCSGQNKNTIVAAMLLYSVIHFTNIRIITLKFFESYHGQSEGDAAHSTISSAMKFSGEIFHPSQLLPIFRLARINNPFVVHALTFKDFLDFKTVATDLRILCVRKDDNGDKIDWTTMRELMVMKTEPLKIFFKESHLLSLYRSLTLQIRGALNNQLQCLNKQPTKLSAAKYKDLMSLCDGETPVIRDPDIVNFFQNLPH